MTSVAYRSDIDRLRAIAVLAVVLYHYGIGPFAGGFVGVDIFFVISGYLITGIIQKEIELGRFAFGGFYERRVRRIFPALFVMLLVTMAVGAWLLLPSDLVQLGNGTLATMLFASNVLFWRQSGYFDTSSEYNPLLHTWSLSVEEQFYIGLPIFLILLHRFSKGWLRAAMILCAIASFALCVWIQALRPTAVFFLSPFRAWELLLGGLLAIGGIPPIRTAHTRLLVSVVALLLLLFSLWWIKAGPAFPGWQAVLPVAATAALLHAGAQGNSPVQRLLSLKPLVFVGLISYSLYLWHWPLLVFVRYRNGMEPLSVLMGWLLLGAAVLLAVASYRWVEKPLRRRSQGARDLSRRGGFMGATAASLVLAGTALAVRLEDGWQARFPPEVVALDEARHPVIPFQQCDRRVPDLSNDDCKIGVREGTPRVIVWGDSHALAWAPALDDVLKKSEEGGALMVHSACPPLIDVDNPVSMGCRSFNNMVMQIVRRNDVDQVILTASWLDYSLPEGRYSLRDSLGSTSNEIVFGPAFHRTIDVLKSNVKSIIIIGPTPGAPTNAPFEVVMSKLMVRRLQEGVSVEGFNRRVEIFRRAANKYEGAAGVAVVDPAQWFCGTATCRYVSDDFHALYRDASHLNKNGAALVAKHFPRHEIPR